MMAIFGLTHLTIIVKVELPEETNKYYPLVTAQEQYPTIWDLTE